MQDLLILLWHFLHTEIEVSPLTEVTPASVYGVEHSAHVGWNLLIVKIKVSLHRGTAVLILEGSSQEAAIQGET